METRPIQAELAQGLCVNLCVDCVEVEGGDLARVEGYVYVLDTRTNQYTRRPSKRIRLIGLTDSGNIINVLPPGTDLERITYTQSQEKRLVVTDGETLNLDINEFGTTQ
jgi:hypothetical protein